MPAKLTTTVAKIPLIPNKTNSILIQKYYEYMKQNEASENHLNNQLKDAIAYAKFLGPKRTLFSVKREKDILDYLDTKVKPAEQDPERRWITTWNDNVNRISSVFLDGFIIRTARKRVCLNRIGKHLHLLKSGTRKPIG